MGKKRKRTTLKKKPSKTLLPTDSFTSHPYLDHLAKLVEKRSGGQISIKGFIFQFKYAAWKLLDIFNKPDITNSIRIRLEGIEDIDLIKINKKNLNMEFVQVKHSKNKMDSGRFWNLGVMQNFAEVYLKNPDSYFRFVHNMEFSEGHLNDLKQEVREDRDKSAKPLSTFLYEASGYHHIKAWNKIINWKFLFFENMSYTIRKDYVLYRNDSLEKNKSGNQIFFSETIQGGQK